MKIILKNAGAHLRHIKSKNEYKYSTLQQEHTMRFLNTLTLIKMLKLSLPYIRKDNILDKNLHSIEILKRNKKCQRDKIYFFKTTTNALYK